MRLPTIQGIIERRLLINFVAEPEYVQQILPAPFRPKLYKGKSIAGICLIRFKQLRPKGFPEFLGISSENGAHRIAVEWEEKGRMQQGVYIPRRDTSLKLNTLLGGRLFPGKHYLAKFNVVTDQDHYHIDFTSSDQMHLAIDARKTDQFATDSIFETLANVSAFFEQGSIGYSPNGDCYEGLQLQTRQWQVQPLKVERIRSAFFEDRNIFPEGSIQFDNAILMENIVHEWKVLPPIRKDTSRS
ncbi:MAG: DUF2071 domain-containing protein [Taibaiella sp.]|nr:DUF2071 domain-containing protein [Taibaiella sp.]